MTTITINRAVAEQVLEAMRRAVPTGKITLYEWDKAVSDLDAALAQQAEPAQEPVAWRDSDNSDPGQGCTYDKAKAARWPHIYKQPLYTAPPQQAEPVASLNAWAADRLARHGIPMPEGDNDGR